MNPQKLISICEFLSSNSVFALLSLRITLTLSREASLEIWILVLGESSKEVNFAGKKFHASINFYDFPKSISIRIASPWLLSPRRVQKWRGQSSEEWLEWNSVIRIVFFLRRVIETFQSHFCLGGFAWAPRFSWIHLDEIVIKFYVSSKKRFCYFVQINGTGRTSFGHGGFGW